MLIKFTKMHGLGNDFVVLDGINQVIKLQPAQLKLIGDRHFGIGCDQILLVEKPGTADADFRYRIFNADGGEVQQCGNGARCFVKFVHDKGLTEKSEIRVETAAGLIIPRMESDGQITVNMGIPRFGLKDIPFIADEQRLTYSLEIESATVEVSVLSMGNPHAVQVVHDVESAPVEQQGLLVEQHVRFPERVNAGFMQIVGRKQIKLRVYERGAGETLACGTGACAAVVAGVARGLLDAEVRVTMHGGDLTIRWTGEGQPVFMTGPAVTVFEGEINV